MLDYFTSADFFETILAIVIGTSLVVLLKLVDKRLSKKQFTNKSLYHTTKIMLDAILAILVTLIILAILEINGVNVGKYFASLGIVGIAVGFAAQDVLKDFTMGISMMIEGYYKIGDVVIYEERYGKVISFNAKTTRLKMIDDDSILSICNRNITSIAVASDWIDVDVPIGYDVNLLFSRKICKECAKKIERLKYVYSVDFINTQDFADSWIVYRLRVHCLPEMRYAVRRNANAIIQNVFYDNDLSFSYNVLSLEQVDHDRPRFKDDFIETRSEKELSNYKHVYELGRGAEKSKTIRVDESETSVSTAINEAERYATAENLSKKMRLRIRLLSEEVLELTKHIANVEHGEFYIERNGTDYEICYNTTAKMSSKARKDIMAVSTEGMGNTVGIKGTIINAIDSMISPKNSKLDDDETNMIDSTISKSYGDYKWSLKKYQDHVADENGVEMRNTEKRIAENSEISVLNKLSDDVRVSVRGNHIFIVVLVKSEE